MTENEKIVKTLYEDATFPLTWADKVTEALTRCELAEEEGLYYAKWVPVNIELPNEPSIEVTEDDAEYAILEGIVDEYIVTINGAQVPTALYYLGNGVWWDETVSQTRNVIAWMPLPKTYRKKG